MIIERLARLETARRPLWLLLFVPFFLQGCGGDSASSIVVTQHMVTAEDGVQIALFQYNLSTGPSETRPILLCPGFSENHLAFDLNPETSVARYLAGLGIDTWVIDFRGRGASGVPAGTRLFDGKWSIDDFGYLDIRAAAQHISELSPDGKMFLLGFSEGDAASVAYMLEDDASILAGYVGMGPGTVLGATNQQPAEDFPPFQFLVNSLSPAAYVIPANIFIPFPELVDWAYELAAEAGVVDQLLDLPLWNILWNTENMTHEMAVDVLTTVLGDISSNVLKQFLKGAAYFHREGICTFRNSALEQKAGGRFCYADRLSEIEVPVLIMAGSADVVVPQANARFVFERYGSQDKTFRMMGRDYGQTANYGHDDLTFGIHVNQDISPVIAEWVKERM